MASCTHIHIILHTTYNCISVLEVELTVGVTGSTSIDETMNFGSMERGIITGMMGATVGAQKMSNTFIIMMGVVLEEPILIEEITYTSRQGR